jgi:hypothetical protein
LENGEEALLRLRPFGSGPQFSQFGFKASGSQSLTATLGF